MGDLKKSILTLLCIWILGLKAVVLPLLTWAAMNLAEWFRTTCPLNKLLD